MKADVLNNLIGALLILGMLATLAKCQIDTKEAIEHRREVEAIYKFKTDSIKGTLK